MKKIKLKDRLLEGIKAGVDRHWNYQKSILKVKPEYLFTISTADALSKGFDNIDFMDIKIHLEKSAFQLACQGLHRNVGLRNYLKTGKENLSRNKRGKVDICVDFVFRKDIYVIEVKGFDPKALEVKKEITRFVDFLTIYGGNTSIDSCFLAFPSTIDVRKSICEQIDKHCLPKQLQYDFFSKGYKTGETPEDGIAFFFSNVLHVKRKVG